MAEDKKVFRVEIDPTHENIEKAGEEDWSKILEEIKKDRVPAKEYIKNWDKKIKS